MSGTDPDTDDGSLSGGNSIRKQLKACLSTSESTGNFVYQDTHESYPNPCLKIKDIGNVGLPLSLRDVDAVKQASDRAPFGKGTETIVDETVRKTWQIDAADLELSNPRWSQWVENHLLPRCCDALGVLPSARPV